MEFVQTFDQVAFQYSEKVAVLDDHSFFTYKELCDQTSQLAHLLIYLNPKKGNRIGILAQRSSHLPLAILGVMKAGGVYVPFDPEYPLERLARMLELSGVEVLLVDQSSVSLLTMLSKYKSSLKEIVLLENTSLECLEDSLPWVIHCKSGWQKCLKTTPEIDVNEEDSLAILFTSGSTGNPKGVELSNRGYSNNFENMQRLIELDEFSRMAQMASPCFDISATELWMPLLFGATVCIASDQTKKNPWALSKWMNHHKINIIQFVPSLFQAFLFALRDEEISFDQVEKLLFIGEALPSTLVTEWYQVCTNPDCKVYNLYGPVEASVEVSAYVLDKNTVLQSEHVPIGKPFNHTAFEVEDALGKPARKGELYIKGKQLAKGYLDPAQTIQAFKNNRYRTGDIVECMPSGDFMFLMRGDRQVKIRGYRIELREIESALNSHAKVRHSAVIVSEQTKYKKIQAFLIAAALSEEEIREFLKEKLPQYMIPNEIFMLDELPLNSNGKVDYNVLQSTI